MESRNLQRFFQPITCSTLKCPSRELRQFYCFTQRCLVGIPSPKLKHTSKQELLVESPHLGRNASRHDFKRTRCKRSLSVVFDECTARRERSYDSSISIGLSEVFYSFTFNYIIIRTMHTESPQHYRRTLSYPNCYFPIHYFQTQSVKSVRCQGIIDR